MGQLHEELEASTCQYVIVSNLLTEEISIIAEVKRSSPSKGALADNLRSSGT